MAILANQKILTLDYWKRADQLQEGDIVFNRYGKPVKVTLIQKYTPPQCYEVHFNDWLTVAGDNKLGFFAETFHLRNREPQYKGKYAPTHRLKNKTVDHLLTEPLYDKKKHCNVYSIRTAEPLQLPYQDLPVPPFVFGFWFFNRKKDKTLVPPVGLELPIHTAFKDGGYKIKLGWKTSNNRKRFTVTPTIESQLVPDIPTRIPEPYLMGSYEQRFELLKGILHSKKGCYNKTKDMFRITTLNGSLIRQVQWLAESLGHRTNLFNHPILNNWTLQFKSRLVFMENQNSKPLRWAYGRRHIVKVTEISPEPCVYIKTNDKDGTFLVGEGFIACR